MSEGFSESMESLSTGVLEKMYVTMLKIRLFEEKVVERLYEKEIICPVHLYVGQEAIAAGVCQNLNIDDYVFSTHRSHGHYIAKGGGLKELMAELYGKETGCSKGKGGSMHLVAPEVGYMGSSAIVAGSIPLALGTAFSGKLLGNGKVTVAFFGDGATDEGVFYESLNIASLYKLPIIFVCENNLFSTHLPISMRQANPDLSMKVKANSIPFVRVDGNDAVAVYNTARKMIEKTRNGEGPAFIECMTFRWLAHVGPTPDLDVGYRRKKDVEYWMERCPIKKIRSVLTKKKDYSSGKLDDIENSVKKEVEESFEFTKASNYPNSQNLLRHAINTESEVIQ